MEAIKTFFKTYKKPIGTLVFLIVYIVIAYVIYTRGTFHALKKYSLWTNSIFVVGLFLALLLFFNQTDLSIQDSPQPKWYTQLGRLSGSLFFILFGMLLLFGALYIISSYDTLSYLMTYLFFIGAVIGGLYLIFHLISNTATYKATKNNPLFKIIYHLLFLVPCEIVKFIRHIIRSSANTPQFVYYILLIELIFVVGYLLLPILDTYIFTHDATVLLQKPIFLDFEKPLGTYENLKHSEGFRYSYGLSFWTFIDQNIPNLNNSSITDAPILNYGNNPNITYNVKKNLLKIFIKEGIDGKRKIYENANFPLQKWNNFVINYTNGILDVFLNGILVATDKHAVSYMTLDNVTSGLENGLQGGIKNVLYFKEPLSKYKIQTLYKHYK